VDDDAVRQGAEQEIIRRYFRYACEHVMGLVDSEAVHRIDSSWTTCRSARRAGRVVQPAREAARVAEQKGKGNDGIFCGAALELPDGCIITGCNSPLMHAAASLVLNAVKRLAGIPDEVHLLPPEVIDSIAHLKTRVLDGRRVSLDTEEMLTALAVSTPSSTAARAAVARLGALRGCEMHLTHMPTPGDEAGLRRLAVNITSDPDFATKLLFVT
jgi:uncharacterized protein (UPF0371 family)